MAPLNPNNTPRYLIDYTSYAEPHVLQVRFATTELEADIDVALLGIADAMKPLMATSDSILGSRKIAAGSNISIPFPVVGLDGAGTGVTGALVPEMKTSFFSVTGKDATGRDVRVTLFSVFAEDFPSYRQPIGVVAPIYSNWWDACQGTPSAPTVTINDEIPFWNPYINRGNNSYFQRKTR